jgi:hypothetical protein
MGRLDDIVKRNEVKNALGDRWETRAAEATFGDSR